MINGQKEIWISTNNNARTSRRIIALSNCGRIMRANGSIEFSTLRQGCCFNGERKRIHVILAEFFIKKTDEDRLYNRELVDHITHKPTNINVNDIRNLRWCTHKENSNFDEAKLNRKLSGTLWGDKPAWNKNITIPRTEFGKLFFEHYKISINENYNLYRKEKRYFDKNNSCSWEQQ